MLEDFQHASDHFVETRHYKVKRNQEYSGDDVLKISKS